MKKWTTVWRPNKTTKWGAQGVAWDTKEEALKNMADKLKIFTKAHYEIKEIEVPD